MIADEKLGVSLEEALRVVARRMKSTDLEQVVMVAMLQRETGGNTAEVIDRVAEMIREHIELRRLVRTLTAQGRLSRWVVLRPGCIAGVGTGAGLGSGGGSVAGSRRSAGWASIPER